jgi:hypothetical protein
MTDIGPIHPYLRGPQHYKAVHREITARTKSTERKELFTVALTATSAGENSMDEKEFLIDLIFKPKYSKLKLRPEETQLLLAHIGEILGELEAEEERIIEEEKAVTELDKTPCK